MAEIRPFCGWRYETGQIGSLANVVAPPCDHITDALRDGLYDKHEFNVVRLTLNRPQPDDTQNSAAQRAAQALRHWKLERVLVPDHEAAIYVLHQEFERDGKRYLRRGFIARVRANPETVRSHEQTHRAYEDDRIAVRDATGLDVSPICGFYKDKSNSVQDLLDDASRGITALEVTDTDGVLNRMWTITNHQTIGLVTGLLSEEAVYIADGHHRFAAAVRHGQQVRESGGTKDEQDAADFVMIHLVGSGDAGLMMLPVHRLISGLAATNSGDLQRLIANDFDFETASSAAEAWELMQIDGRQSVLGLGTSDGRWVLAIAKNMAPDVPASDVFERLNVGRLGGSAKPVTKRVHCLESAVAAVSDGKCQLACLMLPPTLDTITNSADTTQPLAPKSTYFHPKTPAGLVFNPIR
jgi:uncharacterized protein (DUF1015 family)